jgi:hypothetical protein
MSEENALASVSPDPAPAAAPQGNTAEPVKTPETPAVTAEPGKEPEAGKTPEAGTDAVEAAKATEAAKALAARKQSAGERIAQMRRAQGEAERRAERAEKELADIRARLKEPDPAAFDDVSKLNAAQLTHALDAREADRKAAEIKDASAEADAARIDAWRERLSVFKETANDWDQVALSAPINEAVAKDITFLEEGPQIAYYLGKHPAQARALNNLSSRERALELGRIAGRLTAEPPRKVTTAPTPVDAVSGKGAQTSPFDPRKASMDEYAAKRKAGWKG